MGDSLFGDAFYVEVVLLHATWDGEEATMIERQRVSRIRADH